MSVSPDPIARLKEAIALAQRGEREAARFALVGLTADQPQLELAWLWLASVSDDPTQRITALRRVLQLNPANEKARAALTRLVGADAAAEVPGVNAAATDPVQAAPTEPPQSVPAPPASRSPLETVLAIAAIAIAVIVVVLLGANIAGGRLFAQPTATDTTTPTFTATSTPLVSFTPTITPGGPTFTPYRENTLPPTWTPNPSDTLLPSLTPLPTLTPLATSTELPSATSTLESPAVGITATPRPAATLPPLATIAQVTAVTASAATSASTP